MHVSFVNLWMSYDVLAVMWYRSSCAIKRCLYDTCNVSTWLATLSSNWSVVSASKSGGLASPGFWHCWKKNNNCVQVCVYVYYLIGVFLWILLFRILSFMLCNIMGDVLCDFLLKTYLCHHNNIMFTFMCL